MKVIIIGGGIGGLTCARACLDAGMEVALYERRSLEGLLSGSGGIFIQRNAMRVYQLLGLSDRVTRVFTTSRQVGQLAQTDTAIGCWIRNQIYQLTPTWLADLQFKWLFDYRPEWVMGDG